MKTVMIVGKGGRCNAMAEAFAKSPLVGKVYCAPGNPGMAEVAECLAIDMTDAAALADFAARNNVDLTIVGPEAPLVAGIVDEFRRHNLRIFGPTKGAALIEGSKEFAKDVMKSAGVPTAPYTTFDDYAHALAHVKTRTLPMVIKFDGLAGGKGVTVAKTYEEATKALHNMLVDREFGAGRVIVEDYLEGREFSLLCLVNGEKVYPLAVARDYKRAYDDDMGPNTGGMGAYSPVWFVTPEVEREALENIMEPVARELVSRGMPFTGLLYGGLILTEDGPMVIEFNARFGDPETEVVLPRLKSDLYAFIEAAMNGEDFPAELTDDFCMGVVLASKGYPGSYAKDIPVELPADPGRCFIYQMGTRKEADGRLVSNGGRVLMVGAMGKDVDAVRSEVMKEAAKIAGNDFYYRKDIGKDAI